MSDYDRVWGHVNNQIKRFKTCPDRIARQAQIKAVEDIYEQMMIELGNIKEVNRKGEELLERVTNINELLNSNQDDLFFDGV